MNWTFTSEPLSVITIAALGIRYGASTAAMDYVVGRKPAKPDDAEALLLAEIKRERRRNRR